MSDLRYPCARCGVMRTKEHGGTVFTVCDACWTQDHGPSFPERLAAAIRERDAAIQRAATAEGKLREATYAALAAAREAEGSTCTGCGVRLGDAHCGACAGRATVERIADWLERLGYMSPEHVALVRVGAWRGKVSP